MTKKPMHYIFTFKKEFFYGIKKLKKALFWILEKGIKFSVLKYWMPAEGWERKTSAK